MRYIISTLLLMLLFGNRYVKAQKTIQLNEVPVFAERKVDTVFGTWKFSVADYEFYQDKLILLAFGKDMTQSKVVLVDKDQKVLSYFDLPEESRELFKDYQGNVNVICGNHSYKIKIIDDVIILRSLAIEDFNAYIKPCIDTIGKELYFSNFVPDYPEFSYFAFNTADSSLNEFKTVTDQELMRDYNMEYYFLKSKEKLQVRRLAEEFKIDKHRIAAHMRGLTGSMFYAPLYAPLFVVHDTVLVFDHYNNAILKYNKRQERIDSISINYHHPKNWKEWKRKIIMDSENHKAYALFQKGGFYYLKQIDLKTGNTLGTFKLSNEYVEKIRIKNDYVYYVYRPFESLQEQFVYKELIRN